MSEARHIEAMDAIAHQLGRLDRLYGEIEQSGDAALAEDAAKALRLGVDQLIASHDRRCGIGPGWRQMQEAQQS